MPCCSRTRALFAAALASALLWIAPAAAEDATEPAPGDPTETEAPEQVEPEVVAIDAEWEEIWEVVNPWEDDGIRTHGGSRR